MRLMWILYCILGLHSHSIDLTNTFAQEDIPSGETILIGEGYVDFEVYYRFAKSKY